MNIAAYCRVSTDSRDQLNSLSMQKTFFEEYAARHSHALVRVYADEGISGTKTKNRAAFLQLLHDARHGDFDAVVVKDISRFARNTVDFLNAIRQLKALGVETIFLTANQTVLGNSEFILTIFGALAQEESANTSKRVKFGKRLNAQKGRVPNLVYGYDKISGDYFTLQVNVYEAEVVRRVYSLYIDGGYGANKIAQILNADGVTTKRGCRWSQNAVSRILTNALYTGKVINGKQEVADFLTGVRRDVDASDWLVVHNEALRIIDDVVYDEAQRILSSRHEAFNVSRERQSNKYLFSTLIRCACCGYSFRRVERVYQSTRVKWVCGGRNAYGAGSCDNAIAIDEHGLIQCIKRYFVNLLKSKDGIMREIQSEFARIVGKHGKSASDTTAKSDRLVRQRQRYVDLYADGVITHEALLDKIGRIDRELDQMQRVDRGDAVDPSIRVTTLDDAVQLDRMNNAQLRRIIDKIIVDKDGAIDAYIKSAEHDTQ